MHVQHFNRSTARRAQAPAPTPQPLRFEDTLLVSGDPDAAFALDQSFESYGNQAFVLVPGVVCCPTDDGGMYLSRPQS